MTKCGSAQWREDAENLIQNNNNYIYFLSLHASFHPAQTVKCPSQELMILLVKQLGEKFLSHKVLHFSS